MKLTKMERGSALALVAIAAASLAHAQYEYFTQTLSIQTSAVPIVFTETDNSGAGNLWRMPLDGGKLRFDVSTSGFFDTYFTPLTLVSGSRVGINTTNPQEALHVEGGIRVDRSTYPGVNFYNGANPLATARVDVAQGIFQIGDIFSTAPALPIAFYSNDAERMRISADGKVGIGTSSPAEALSVYGSNGAAHLRSIGLGPAPNRRWVFAAQTYNAIPEFGIYPLVFTHEAEGYSGDFVVQQSGGNFVIEQSGNVGIGTNSPQNKLDVNGTIRAKEVIVESGWADYVFEKDYDLPSLGEVSDHIRTHGRLPGVPSAEEVAQNGVSIGESQRILLAKIEELTLYVMQLENDKTTLRSDMKALSERFERFEAEAKSRTPSPGKATAAGEP